MTNGPRNRNVINSQRSCFNKKRHRKNKMTKFVESLSIYETFSTLYYILKPSGLAPYKLNKKSRKLQWNGPNAFYAVLINIASLTLSIYMIVKLFVDINKNFSVISDCWRWMEFLILMSNSFLNISNALGTRTMEDILRILDDFDQLVSFNLKRQ